MNGMNLRTRCVDQVGRAVRSSTAEDIPVGVSSD